MIFKVWIVNFPKYIEITWILRSAVETVVVSEERIEGAQLHPTLAKLGVSIVEKAANVSTNIWPANYKINF